MTVLEVGVAGAPVLINYGGQRVSSVVGSPFKKEKRQHAKFLWPECACGLGQHGWRESCRELGQKDGSGVLEVR